MKPQPNDDEYRYRHKRLSKRPQAMRPYEWAELERIIELMDKYLNPNGDKKSTTTESNFDDLCNDVNQFRLTENIGKKVKPVYLRNLYIYDRDPKYKELTEQQKQEIKIPKNSNYIIPIVAYLEHRFGTAGIVRRTNIIIDDWFPNTKGTGYPQQADFLIIPLDEGRLKRITCNVFSDSDYYRFGFKFIGGSTFGIGKIESIDRNVLIHTGKGSMRERRRDGLFVALYVNGERILIDGKKTRDRFIDINPAIGESFECEIFVDDDDLARFKINGEEVAQVLVERQIQKKVHVLSWADNEEYDIAVKDIRIEVRHH